MFNSNLVYFDIETISKYDVDSQLPEFIDEYINESMDKRLKSVDKIKENKQKIIRNLALDPYVGQVLLIGTLSDNAYLIYVNKELLDRNIEESLLIKNAAIMYYDNEKQLLEAFIDDVNNLVARNGLLVSFNGKEFDLPYIFKRAIMNDITSPIANYLDLINRYNYNYHIDLYHIFDTKLKKLAIAYNILNSDISGEDIAELYDNVFYEKIIDKNIYDLTVIQQLYNKVHMWLEYKIKTAFSVKYNND